ncbi:hypothetical protein GCM10029964_099350 [Kibdelosporangium lantanae]
MRNITGPIIKMAVFTVVTITLTALLGATIANSNFGDTSSYKARFSDASGLKLGDDVRILGVKVGTVDRLSVVDDHLAEVGFDIDAGRRLPPRPPRRSATATWSASGTSPWAPAPARPRCSPPATRSRSSTPLPR